MSVPLRYRRHQGLPRSPDAAHEPTSPAQDPRQVMQSQQNRHAWQRAQHNGSPFGGHFGSPNGLGLHENPQYAQQIHAQQYAQQHAQQYAQQYLRYHQHGPAQQGAYARSPDLQSSPSSRSSPSGSPNMQGHSPNLNQPVTRKPRPYNRADRAMGRIVDGYKEPNQDAIDRLIASTASQSASVDSEPADTNAGPARQRTRPDAAHSPPQDCTVSIRLPSRQVVKRVSVRTTAAELIAQLVKEHRLEFEFEHNNEGDGDDVLLWECIEGTRRPLRPNEHVGPVVYRWGKSASRCYLRTTSTSLRNDVDSLASLVPRRDMLRTPPKIQAADVSFSRPSVMYNSHMNNYTQSRSPPLSPSPEKSSDRGFPSRRDTNDLNNSANGNGGAEHLTRVPSKINPNDKCLVAKRVRADNDDIALQTQLVWGFGSLDLDGSKLTLKQKPGDELVCSLSVPFTDIYEWPHTGPKKYNLVLRAQQLNSRSVYLSTDSAKVFNIVRNAIFTARTKELLDQQQRKR